MKDKFKMLMSKTWFGWIVIPLFLLFVSFFFLLIFAYSSKSFIVVQNENVDVFDHLKPGEIMAGQKVTGKFTAVSDFMGIVSIRFNTYARINNDSLIFRLKEKGSPTWYYENLYKVDQFQPNELFPFGFPRIGTSRNKVYVFELESTKGKHNDAIAINPDPPVIMMSYQFPVNRIFSHEGLQLLSTHKIGIVLFIFEAISTHTENLIILFLPITLYFLWMSWKMNKRPHLLKKSWKMNDHSQVLVNITGMAFLGYIFIIGRFLPNAEENNPAVIILLLSFTILIVKKYKMSYLIYFIFTIVLIFLMMMVLLVLDRPDIANRSALLAYLLLVTGIIVAIIDRKKKVYKGSLRSFLNDVWGVKLLFLISEYLSTRILFYNKVHTKVINEVNKGI